ncbi:hypothetical protein M153_43710001, partial [Pseudoloma neurophilia]
KKNNVNDKNNQYMSNKNPNLIRSSELSVVEILCTLNGIEANILFDTGSNKSFVTKI